MQRPPSTRSHQVSGCGPLRLSTDTPATHRATLPGRLDTEVPWSYLTHANIPLPQRLGAPERPPSLPLVASSRLGLDGGKSAHKNCPATQQSS